MAFIRINTNKSNVVINTNYIVNIEFYESGTDYWNLEIHFINNEFDLCYEESNYPRNVLLKLFTEIEKILYTNSNPNQDFIELNLDGSDVVRGKTYEHYNSPCIC